MTVWTFVRNLVEIGNKFIASLLVAIVLLLPATLPASADNAQYFYDPGGRLIGMIDTTAGSATYSYDQAGNIKTIVRTPSSTIGVVQFFPSSGPTGTLVKISGTAFVGGTTTVKFGTVTAAPTSVTANEIVVPVPSTFTGSAAITISTTSPAISTSTTPFTVTSPAGAPTITSFTPTKQVQGSSVTVTGTHFNTLNSKVYVNGQAAQITGTPTSTSITFNVPQASSGKVSVQTLVSTATSGSDLIVPPGSLTAAQVTNTVRTTIGAAPTVIATGGAGTATLIRFDVTNQTGVAAHVNLTSTGNTTVQLLGPSGGVLKSQSVGLSDVWVSASDQIEPGTYTLAVLPSTSGSVTATLYDLPIAPTATVPMDGTTTTLVTSAPGQKALFTFAGTAGQKAMVHFDWSGFPEWLNYYWSQPDGTFLTVTPNAETSSWLSVAPVTLQQTGTYKLLAAPGFAFNATPPIGTISANVFSVPPDITAQAPLDGTHAVLDFGTPGMRGTFTLDSPAPNTKITLFVLNQVAGGSDVTLKDPNGLVVIPTTYYCCTGWLGNAPIILSQQGTYNLEVVPHIAGNAPANTGIGQITIAADKVPADVTASVPLNGTQTPLTFGHPGMHGTFTFVNPSPNTPKKKITLFLNNSTMTSSTEVELFEPGGASPIAQVTFNDLRWLESDPVTHDKVFTLDDSGTYTLKVHPILSPNTPFNAGTGTLYTAIFTVPIDDSKALTVGGGTQTLTISTPGQQGRFNLSISPSQVGTTVAFSFTHNLTTCWKVTILNPDGTDLLSETRQCGNYTSPQLTLAQSTSSTPYVVKIVPELAFAITDGTGMLGGSVAVSP